MRSVASRSLRTHGGACWATEDSSIASFPVESIFSGPKPRDIQSVLARLGNQMVALNSRALGDFGARASFRQRDSGAWIDIETGSRIGALALISPTTGRHDYGLVVRPRFGWRGIGPMLADMGFKVLPSINSSPMLPRSERTIPEWVLPRSYWRAWNFCFERSAGRSRCAPRPFGAHGHGSLGGVGDSWHRPGPTA